MAETKATLKCYPLRLPEKTFELLKICSEEAGKPISEVIREMIDSGLEWYPPIPDETAPVE